MIYHLLYPLHEQFAAGEHSTASVEREWDLSGLTPHGPPVIRRGHGECSDHRAPCQRLRARPNAVCRADESRYLLACLFVAPGCFLCQWVEAAVNGRIVFLVTLADRRDQSSRQRVNSSLSSLRNTVASALYSASDPA